MAYLVNNDVLISNNRDLLGVGTAGINTALYVGNDIQLDAGSGIITATSFVGSGIGLTGINANVIVSDGIPTGISTTEGDLYYDSTDLKLFTYYDNNWVEASPVPPGATTLEVTNAVGAASTVQIDLLTETLILSGTGNEIEVGVNTSTNTLTFGLTNDVSIGGSITANKYYGDGSNLIGLSASQVTSQDYGAATGDLPMPFLSAVGAGASIYTDMSGTEDFTYDPANGILKAKEFDALSDMRFKTNIIEIEDPLAKVEQLRGVEYDWTNGSGSSVGIIAQELQEVYPQLVSETEERLTVNYNGLVGLLIAAVKEIGAELKDLKSRM